MTRHEDKITGVVLAGGLSSRLGEDKALLSLDGAESFMERSVRILRQLLPTVLVIGRNVPALNALSGVKCLEDEKAGRGPAGGIVTALRYSRSSCLAVSCDMPFMDAPTLQGLILAWPKRRPNTLLYAYQQEETCMVENLAGIYSVHSLAWLDASLAKQHFKISLILPEERQQNLVYNHTNALPFFNVNYPADLALAKKYAALRDCQL